MNNTSIKQEVNDTKHYIFLHHKYIHPSFWISDKKDHNFYYNIYISNYKEKQFTEGYAQIPRREYFAFYYMKELNIFQNNILIIYANFINKINNQSIKNNLDNNVDEKFFQELLNNLLVDINEALDEYYSIFNIIIILLTEYLNDTKTKWDGVELDGDKEVSDILKTFLISFLMLMTFII